MRSNGSVELYVDVSSSKMVAFRKSDTRTTAMIYNIPIEHRHRTMCIPLVGEHNSPEPSRLALRVRSDRGKCDRSSYSQEVLEVLPLNAIRELMWTM
jgi:hypothetical protein